MGFSFFNFQKGECMSKAKRVRKFHFHTHDASKKGHKHKHNPTWLPPTRVAKTHAWYRRNKQVPPSRLKKEEQKRAAWHVRRNAGQKKKE